VSKASLTFRIMLGREIAQDQGVLGGHGHWHIAKEGGEANDLNFVPVEG
jgi:hypothetical protein